MARYFFDVKNGHRLIDPSGIDCCDDHEAIKAGVLITQQIPADAPTSQPRHVAVLNDERQEVGQVPVSSEEDRNGGK